VPQTPSQRLIDRYAGIGDTAGVEGLENYRKQFDPFKMKERIEKRLSLIWKLDSALNQAEDDGGTDMERVARPILQGHLIYLNTPKPEPKIKSATKSAEVA